MSLKRKISKSRGFTLIEVITTIVVLSIAATAIMSVFTSTIRTSADPMIQQQALSIAEAYMEEILLTPFDDVENDYDNLTVASVTDQNGTAIAALSDYTVSITVDSDGLNGIATADAFLIRVSVAHTVLAPIVLHGYRTRYP